MSILKILSSLKYTQRQKSSKITMLPMMTLNMALLEMVVMAALTLYLLLLMVNYKKKILNLILKQEKTKLNW
ncbi:hypothetical protein RU61_03263 [Salmonella enterica subsp. enterica serovar Derby]|nr:hypothetical protein SEED0626_08496 [Salmonella enterica subsp. enterica serovar Derby str. 626]KMM40764.1 hypothetical protein RU61_03263 [Salmonella enterica subsp. enterica serovar Derby]